jgi:cellulose synthase/poly-beta-1,6-N-acetylglucosamine synthase-like glycosyltransferase
MGWWLAGFLLWLGYAALFGYYRRGWKKLPQSAPSPSAEPIFITVLVPARNEEKALPALIAGLQLQTYPAGQFEVLVLDDHSADGTAKIVYDAGCNMRLLPSPENATGKKAALALGVAAAKGSLIVTTDADCRPGPQWLASIAALHISKKSAFIAAPVRYQNPQAPCAVFQTLDFITLQGITAASVATGFHSMCNGANLAFTKEAFRKVDGYAGIDKLASGDDLLLMHKIAVQYPGRVQYLKHESAIVDTDAAPGWIAFWKQRIRWASKSAHYQDRRIFWALLGVYFFNVYFLVLACVCAWLPLLILIILKTIVELLFITPVARFFKQQYLLLWFPFLQPLHILYTVAVGLFSQFGTYEWKGRRLK